MHRINANLLDQWHNDWHNQNNRRCRMQKKPNDQEKHIQDQKNDIFTVGMKFDLHRAAQGIQPFNGGL